MSKLITKKLATVLSCCLLLLSACDNGDNGIHTSSVSVTSTPASLRSIATNELTAVVTVDGATHSYYGRDFPDNNWIIYLNIEPAKEYSIKIEWIASNDVLVMVQEGTLQARNSEEVASPLLNSISEGGGFDYDCDLISNLDEVINGTDPGQATGAACLVESASVNVVDSSDIITPPTPSETLIPIVRQNYDLFENTQLQERVTRFSQPIKVHSTNLNRRSAYRISLSDVTTAVSISIDLLDDPRFGRFARVFNNNVDTNVTLQAAHGADATCSDTHCSMPFDWQQGRWYELIFEEDKTDSTAMRAYIVDPDTQIITQIGTLLIPENTVWTRPIVVLFYHERLTASNCAAGLLPATLHYRAAIANNLASMGEPVATPATNCSIWGGGASTSKITGDPLGDIFTLTLGER